MANPLIGLPAGLYLSLESVVIVAAFTTLTDGAVTFTSGFSAKAKIMS